MATASDDQFAHEEMIEEIEESAPLPSEAESAAGRKPKTNLKEDELEEDEFDEETNVAERMDAEESDDPGVDGFEPSEDESTAR